MIDCGALTDDATTITMIGTDSKLRITEACVSDGGSSGTTAIICRFLKALEEKFGTTFSDVLPERLDRGTPFYDKCETILQIYDGKNPGTRYWFPLELRDDFLHNDYRADTGEVSLSE